MQNETTDSWYKIAVVLMCAFAALFYHQAWQFPIIDGFPLAERMLDANFNPNDFFTNTFASYSPRFYIVNFYVIGASLFDIHYTQFVAYANISRIFIIFVALYFLYLGLLNNKKSALIALYLSSLSYLAIPKMLAWWPLVFDLTGSGMADMFLMIAWALVVFNRLYLAYIAIAFGLLFHPVVGIYGFLISVILLYSKVGFQGIANEFKKPQTYLFAGIVLASFLANYIPYTNALNGFKLDDASYINILVNFKHPHHYLPSHFEWQLWASFAVFSCMIFAMWQQVRKGLFNKNIIVLVAAYAVVMMLIGWLFTEIYPVRLAASLIPFRGFPILIPIFMVVTASFMYQKFKQGDYASFLLLHLPILPYNSVGLTWYIFPDYHRLTLPTVIAVIVFSLIILFQQKPMLVNKINSMISIVFINNRFYKSVVLVALLLVAFAVMRFEIKIPTFDNTPELYQWLNTNLNDKDIIVAELNAANNQKIRLLSKRALVVTKDFPFLETHYQEWYERYSDVYLNQQKARGHIDKLTANELNSLLDKYQASILLRTKVLGVNAHFELMDEVVGEAPKVYIYKNKSIVGE